MSNEFYGLEKKEKPPILWDAHLESKNSTPEKLIVMVAPTGGLLTKEQNPNIPYTSEEITKEVVLAYKAGASMVHVHARDERGFGSGDPKLYRRQSELIKKKCPDIIFAFSATHGTDTIEERLKPVVELGIAETVVINMGSMSIGPAIFRCTDEYIVSGAKYLVGKGIKPSFGCYYLNQIAEVDRLLIKPGIIKKPYFFDLCLGIHPPAMPGKIGNLKFMVDSLPSDSVWTCIAGGRNWLPILVEAILLGAPIVRTGLEDTLYMYPHSPKHELVKSSADLVAKVVRIAKELGIEIATPDEARKILGLAK